MGKRLLVVLLYLPALVAWAAWTPIAYVIGKSTDIDDSFPLRLERWAE